ncbi:MAG: chemotaxis protein CheR, partial [Thermoanaerobaculia bacterium]|nr:chemotaxis protein CheR [Thermoanaerobaculia bacterium]
MKSRQTGRGKKTNGRGASRRGGGASSAGLKAPKAVPEGEQPVAATPDSRPPQAPAEGNRFPIVGVGASAGGLEAFTQLLAHLPNDLGMAYVFVQHLDPNRESLLQEILARATSMPVREALNGMKVEPNSVYLMPAKHGIELADGTLKLV